MLCVTIQYTQIIIPYTIQKQMRVVLFLQNPLMGFISAPYQKRCDKALGVLFLREDEDHSLQKNGDDQHRLNEFAE